MRTTLALAAVLLAACEAAVQTDADGLRTALPEEAAIRMASPAPPPSPTATTAEVVAAAPTFGSGYARTTFWAATTVNAGVAWTLGRLRAVASLPPTTCDVASCTWGPWTDREGLNVWRLVARRDGTGWSYLLDARRGSDARAAFAPIVAGVAHPGALPSRGSGSFAVDFDAAAALDHAAGWQQEDFGRLEVAYDAREAVRVDATALGARSRDPDDPVRLDAVYAFRATAAGGDLQVALQTLEVTPRNLSLRSRWDAAGAGRGDAAWVSAGLQYRASECWSGAALGFSLLYDDDPLAGYEGACAFVPALFADLTLP
ncbi:hypothetical protein [Anaeromyxobacter sp. SG64]|uniref:hypothetical protein n=1 Tax=Anaeromyxobacter sp. SG64 TaxID=2925409 RepID=UPI001F583B0A|nr:hypothetical protein [Anaeromyxobacter sp. SG64]